MNHKNNNQKTDVGQIEDQLEEIFRSPFTTIRFEEGYDIGEIVGEVQTELFPGNTSGDEKRGSIGVSPPDHLSIITIYEDKEFAKEVDSEFNYEVNSDEFIIHRNDSGEPIVSPFIPGFLEHRLDTKEADSWAELSPPYKCTCGEEFESIHAILDHDRKKIFEWAVNILG